MDGIIEPNLSIFGEEQNPGGGELLSHRAGLVDRVRSRRHLKLHIGKAVAFELEDLPILQNGQRETRNALLLHLSLDELVQGPLVRARAGPAPRKREGASAGTGWMANAGQGGRSTSGRFRPLL